MFLFVGKQDLETPLHTASSRGHLECVQSLIEAKSELDDQDRWGNTALHLAIKRKYSNVAMMLLQAGADFDLGNCVNIYIEHVHFLILTS